MLPPCCACCAAGEVKDMRETLGDAEFSSYMQVSGCDYLWVVALRMQAC